MHYYWFQSFDVIIKDTLKHIYIEASYEARNVIRRKAVHGNDFGLLISLVKRISWDLAGISHERLERGLGLLRSCMKIASPHFMGRRHAPRPPNHHHPCHLYFAAVQVSSSSAWVLANQRIRLNCPIRLLPADSSLLKALMSWANETGTGQRGTAGGQSDTCHRPAQQCSAHQHSGGGGGGGGRGQEGMRGLSASTSSATATASQQASSTGSISLPAASSSPTKMPFTKETRRSN